MDKWLQNQGLVSLQAPKAFKGGLMAGLTDSASSLGALTVTGVADNI